MIYTITDCQDNIVDTGDIDDLEFALGYFVQWCEFEKLGAVRFLAMETANYVCTRVECGCELRNLDFEGMPKVLVD